MTLRYVVSPGGPAIILSDVVLAAFDRFRQLSYRETEAGGQLFAKFDGADTAVLEATGPGPYDRRLRGRFEPHQPSQQLEIRSHHERGLHFVGDWHTHPEPVPYPSYIDIWSMTECFSRSKHDLRNFLLIVVGTAAGTAGLYVALVGSGVTPLHHESDVESNQNAHTATTTAGLVQHE